MSATAGFVLFWLEDSSRLSIEVFRAGNAAGFSKDQIRRAEYRIGAVARKEAFEKDARWSWGLSSRALGH